MIIRAGAVEGEKGASVEQTYQVNCALAREWKARCTAAMRELLAANEQYANYREMARQGMPAGTSADSFYAAVGAEECRKLAIAQGAPARSARGAGRRSCYARVAQAPNA